MEKLALFWREIDPKLKQELQRRYPKHDWRCTALKCGNEFGGKTQIVMRTDVPHRDHDRFASRFIISAVA